MKMYPVLVSRPLLRLCCQTTNVAYMNPVAAAILAGNIESAMSRLSTLDLSPVTNAADIETMRQEAETLTRDLLGYLLSSENFVPVIEADDAVKEWTL